jgi:SAM-dependent methyltransferase
MKSGLGLASAASGTLLGGALGLGVGRVAEAMAGELERRIGRPARVLAVGEPLARALAQLGLPVVGVVEAPRRRKRAPPRVVARTDALPFADCVFDALCAAGMPARSDGAPALAPLLRVVRDGGVVALATAASALVRKVAPPEVVAATLVHARTVDVEQRLVGSTLLSTARARAFR